MAKCSKCNVENQEEAIYCSKCGTRIVRDGLGEKFTGDVKRGAEEFSETVSKGATHCFGPSELSGIRQVKTDRIGFASFGFFLILVGCLYIFNPNISDKIVAFFRDLKLVQLSSGFFLPAPASDHQELYEVVKQFCFTFGIFQAFILIVKFALNYSSRKKADTASDVIFWFGAGTLITMLSNQSIAWFTFLAGLIVLTGLSILIRALAPSK